jgi:hypothetical protein
MAIFLLDIHRPPSLEEISRVMKEKILIDFPRPVMKAILFRLVESGRCTSEYSLSTQRRTKIESQTKSYAKTLDEISNLLAETTEKYFGSQLTTEQKQIVFGSLLKLLWTRFVRRTDICARLITSKEIDDDTNPDPLADLDETLQSIADTKLRVATKSALTDVLQGRIDVVARFLFHLNENLVCMQVLNLDPECQALEKEAFAKKNLLVDTNVIIALLCPSSRQHRLSRELVSLSRQVGARMLVTERTLMEFTKVLNDSNNLMAGVKPSTPLRFLEAVDEEFIASFAIEKKSHPHEKWQGYYLRMQHVKSALRSNYGIEVFSEDRPAILEQPYFSEIAAKVSDCFKKARGKAKKKEVAEHDAYHLILVRELSKENSPTMVGPSHWFLSNDQTLAYVEPLLRTKLGDGKEISALVSDIWLQMIEPFLSRDVREKQAVEAFTDLLESQFAGATFGIKQSVLAELQGDWLNYEWLETDDLEIILGEKFVSDYIAKIKEMRGSGQDTKEVSETFGKQLETRLEALADEKIHSLGKEVRGLRDEVEAKSKTEENLRSELMKERKFGRTWRSCSGIAGLALIFSNLILVGMRVLQFNPYTTAYFIATLLFGAILVLIAIAPENVRVRMEAALGLQGRV